MTALDITRELYAAFGRGDIAAILARLHPDVVWEYGAVSNDVPWYQPRHGRDGVREFFASLAALTWYQFEPKLFLAADDTVMVLLDADYAVSANGRRVRYENAVMLWHFDAELMVRRFAHRLDTHQAWLALHAAPL